VSTTRPATTTAAGSSKLRANEEVAHGHVRQAEAALAVGERERAFAQRAPRGGLALLFGLARDGHAGGLDRRAALGHDDALHARALRQRDFDALPQPARLHLLLLAGAGVEPGRDRLGKEAHRRHAGEAVVSARPGVGPDLAQAERGAPRPVAAVGR
jgi:hypothetical protein